ncbi:MAG: SPOR domain-containing protein [Melioribacteraceae bacterium]|nr:SPOR domain-containing protein [Melioribacteraceae bacterium]
MNKEELLKANAELIGVSSSERELALQILIERISEQLREDGDAVKIEELGVFQLKQDSNKSELIFSFITSTSKPASKTLFLRLPISKISEDDSDDAFSVSIGKPTIPLNYSGKEGEEADTSFLFIKKKIEERVTEILDTAVYMKDFNLWDEYLKSSKSSDEKELDDSELLQNLSEADPEPEEDKIEFPSAPIRDTVEFDTEEIEDENPDEIDDDIFRDLETFKNLSNEDTEEIEDETSTDEDDDLSDSEHDLSAFEKMNENEDHQDEEETELEDTDVFNLDDSIFKEPESEDQVDWSWGDELKNEIETEDDQKDFDADKKETKEKKVSKKVDKEIDEDPFGTLEKTLAGDKEFSMLTGEHEYYKEEKPIDDEVRITNLEKPRPIPPKRTRMTRLTQKELTEETEPPKRTKEYKGFRKSAGGSSVFVIAGIVVILAAIIYFAFSLSGEPDKDVLKPTRTEPVESTQQDNVTEDQPNIPAGAETSQGQTAERSPSNVSSGSSEVEEVRVSNLIFRRGNEYNVQVSSWRSSIKANDEVKRLRSQGHDAFVVQAYLPSKGGTWHRVRIGGFNSVDEARNFLNTNQF